MALLLRTVIVLFVFALTDGTAFAQATATPTSTPSAAPATPIPCALPPSGVVVMLENPSPGDTLLTGTQVVINGVAYDARSTAGPGIASVSIFLGARDAGGLSLGTATLGQPNPGAAAGSPLATAGFTLRTPALPSGSGARSLFVYARALQDNTEATLEVPIFLNSAPTPVRGQVPTPVLPTPVPCTPTPVPTSTSAPTNTPAPVSTNTPTRVATPTPLSLAAPPPPVAAPLPPAAPAPAAPAAAAPPAAVAPTTAQTTAPRGGGIPAEAGLVVLVAGAAIVAGGLSLGRRRRR